MDPNTVTDDEVPVEGPRPIVRLSLDVVNQIAAAEIIHRPSNAIKELLENALDAGSTSIKISLKEGGLKYLQIQDNGCGIRKADLPLLCERYATSKITHFSDLQSLSTYGFRGEALASISYCSKVTVLTKVKEEGHGWKASYIDGKLAPSAPNGTTAEPRAHAANDGTTITAEDLFYNVPLRRKSFKSASEEFQRVMDIVSRYAVHNPEVAWVCKKSTAAIPELSTPSGSTTQQNISLLYGSTLGRELLQVQTRWFPELGVEKIEGWVTNANWNVKKFNFLLFINHRLVESSKIKKAVETLYQTYLPKGSYPYVYLSLEIERSRIDVNVHPTKQEVHFLDEDQVVEAIVGEVSKTLLNANASRTFSVQTLLPGARDPRETGEDGAGPSSSYKPPPKSKVRIDPTERTLESMDMFAKRNPDKLEPSQRPSKRQRLTQTMEGRDDSDPDGVEYVADEDDSDDERGVLAAQKVAPIAESEVTLSSVKKLRDAVVRNGHAELTEIIQKHQFVGLMEDKALALVQSSTKLFLLYYDKFSHELFYQLGLKQFGALNRMKLEPAPSLEELVRVAVESEPELVDAGHHPDQVVEAVVDRLWQRREMLDEYFSFTVSDDAKILNLPLLLHDYSPNLDRLPHFLLCAGLKVIWDDEMKCFESFLHQLAAFYSPIAIHQHPESDEDMDKGEKAEASEQLEFQRHQIEHSVFPALKRYAVMPKQLLEGGESIREVADLPALYRVFERC